MQFIVKFIVDLEINTKKSRKQYLLCGTIIRVSSIE